MNLLYKSPNNSLLIKLRELKKISEYNYDVVTGLGNIPINRVQSQF